MVCRIKDPRRGRSVFVKVFINGNLSENKLTPAFPSFSFCSHETKVKHIVVDSQCDPVAGVLYCITANGPHFDSLFDLIETAQNKPLIQNQSFNVVLKSSPPKVVARYLLYTSSIAYVLSCLPAFGVVMPTSPLHFHAYSFQGKWRFYQNSFSLS